MSWLCPGTRFQPCLWFIREWNDALDLKGPCDAFGALAAASVYMYGNLSKPAAAQALPFAFVFAVALVGDLLFLVGAFADLAALVVGTAAAIKVLFCKMDTLAAAASILALALSVTLVGEFAVLVGIFEFVGLMVSSLYFLCTSTYLEVDPQRKNKFLMHSFSPHL